MGGVMKKISVEQVKQIRDKENCSLTEAVNTIKRRNLKEEINENITDDKLAGILLDIINSIT